MRSTVAYWRLLVTALVAVVCDQITKWWVVQNIPEGTYPIPHSEIISGLLYLVHIHNDGAAWGMLSGYGMWLAWLGILTLIGFYFLRHSFGLQNTKTQWFFGFLIGGIAGNIIDRFVYGHVIDFIDVHLPGYRWPAFNFADAFITIGVALYLIQQLKSSSNEKK